ESLAKLSKGNAEELRKQLAAEGVNGDIQQKAGEVLSEILHKYSYFSVSTIDSFFLKVIRAFARELKLQLGYNIALEHPPIMSKIVDDLLNEIGTDKELTKYLENYVFYNVDDNKGWKIDARIKKLGEEIFKERYWIKKREGNQLADNRFKMQDHINTLF